MKNKLYRLILITFIVFSFGAKETQIATNENIDITGNWQMSIKSETSMFNLNLTQNNETIVGEHCCVMRDGNRIDCVDIDNDDSDDRKTISGKWDGNKWIVNFMSTYCEKTGKAIITVKSKNKIIWRIIEEPDGEFYIPNEIEMVRKK